MAPWLLCFAVTTMYTVLAFIQEISAQQVAINSYAPVNVTCPSRPLLRSSGTSSQGNQAVNAQESLYVENRKMDQVATAFQTFLANKDTGYEISVLAPNATYWPTVGLAVSGGFLRAALVGAGTFQAFDQRNASSVAAGTGGVLQLASYMTGLSGGSLFLSSLAINNMPIIEDLVFGGGSDCQGWFLDYDILLPAGANQSTDVQDYYDNIAINVDLKKNEGFNTSITDAFAVITSYHFGPGGTSSSNFFDISQTEHNTAVQWSFIRNVSSFQNHGMPFPAIVADSQPPSDFSTASNSTVLSIPLNSTVYEFNPYEFGSWDPNLATWIELDYVGTNLYNGQPYNSSSCVNGFSNFGYVMGTSCNLFNEILPEIKALLSSSAGGLNMTATLLGNLLANIGGSLTDAEADLAIYPNPFNGISPGLFPSSGENDLALVDGGEAGASIPLDPLLVKARHVDTIIAIDATGDTEDNWPNGTALRASYARAASLPAGQQTLPYFPSAEVFIGEGLNQRPTFFGCNASQAELDDGMPLIIYLPNSPLNGSYLTNASTYKLDYSRADTQSFLNSMWTTQTRGYPQSGQAQDSDWGTCLACSIVERRRQSQNMTRSSTCETCFTMYCYDYEDSSADGGYSMGAEISASEVACE